MTYPRVGVSGNQIYIDGQWVTVTWESLGTTVDDLGHTLEMFVPILPMNMLTPDKAEIIFDLVKVWDITDNAPIELSYTDKNGFHREREALSNIRGDSGEYLSPMNVFEESKFGALRSELVNQGLDPSIFDIEGVDDFLLRLLQGQKGAAISPNFIKGMKTITDEMQANPSQIPNIIARFQPPEEMTKEKAAIYNTQQTMAAQKYTESLAVTRSQESQFPTELEYQQFAVNQLKEQVGETTGQSFLGRALGPEDLAKQQVVAEYEYAQQRMADIEAGSPQHWTPEETREVEQTKEQQEALKPQKKSALDIEFERLLAQSRRPQRIARL